MKNVSIDKSNETSVSCEGLEVMASVAVSQASEGCGSNMGLLSAFKSGIEQSLALVQQMSQEEKVIAYNTLASLCGETNHLIGKLFENTPASEPQESGDQEQVVEYTLDGDTLHSSSQGADVPPPNDAVSLQDEDLSIKEPVDVSDKATSNSRGKSKRLIAKREALRKTRITEKKQISTKNKTETDTHESEVERDTTKSETETQESDTDSKSDTALDEEPSENVNPKDKVFQCETCNKTLKSRFSLLVHIRTHTGEKPFPCHLCDKTFSCSNNRKRHIRETHEGGRPFNCSRCSTGFFRLLQLEKHLVEDHNLSNKQVKEERQQNVKKKELNLFECKECSKIFKTKSNLRVHEAVHQEERQHICPHCNKKFSFATNLKRHMMLHTGVRPHKCDACNKGFIEYKSLRLHISREHGCPDLQVPDKFTCEECGAQLSSRASLLNHKLTHSGIKSHVCPVCGKAFTMKSNLKRHVRTHTNDKPWECPTCFKRFTEKKSMEVHFRVHTGEKPYSCKECGKTFAQASTLQGHMPVHNKERGVSCELCGKSFLRKSHYKSHMFRHTNPPRHSCSDCPRAFYRKADLDRHHQTHTGERPYHCTMCPKQFSRHLYLKDHLNLHLGQRPYVCAHCPATYAESSARVKHMRRCPMRVTSKPPPPDTPQGPTQEEEEVEVAKEDMLEAGNIVVSEADLDIVTTAMTSAALTSITVTPGGLVTSEADPPLVLAEAADQQEVTAADNLVALANSGMLTLQAPEGLEDPTDLVAKTQALTLPTDSFSLQQLGLQAIDVKEVHVQDVETGQGKTKHYIVVIQPQ